MSQFCNYIGVDYSGAQTATQSLPGLRVYATDGHEDPIQVQANIPPKRYWTRERVAKYLVEYLRVAKRTIVGIDHGFSFPISYYQKYQIPDWSVFLDDFADHWPTDQENVYVDFVREGVVGNGKARLGDSRWRRLCEIRARAKSVFHFDCPGSVAKSTHAGLPWLRYIRESVPVHFWPYDGWKPKNGVHVLAEVYPALWKGRYFLEGTPDQQDAYSICRWLQETDLTGKLYQHFQPGLTDKEKMVAAVEGWILGVV